MCGIAGILGHGSEESLIAAATAMQQAIAHRGPDDSGAWCDASAGIAFGFLRLSIIDLTPAGHQPMTSRSGRWTIVFNGEVYNAEELRGELEGPWRGHSDTEVMLAAIEKWGLRGAVTRFVGMFAFAVWDGHERTLHLVRDRMGVKPLYYGRAGNTLLFGSELKALKAHPDFRAEVDSEAAALYARYGYVPAPWSIYRGIRKLPQGSVASFGASESVTSYWSVREAAMGERFRGTEDEALEQLDALATESVRLRLISDVPLGAFLSGGVDSSTVVALMRKASSRVRTFTIGFDDPAYDESQWAAPIATHLGTEHTELRITAAEAMAAVPKMAEIFDEPFVDSSQIPTYLVAKLARESVTVALSGDGGDELFGGYERYRIARNLRRRVERVPPALRPLASAALKRTPRVPHRERFRKFGRVLGMKSDAELYRHFVSIGDGPAAEDDPPPLADIGETFMYFDQRLYLPDDILVKVDRATMAVSLEGREPLLDHRLVEFSWSLPPSMKEGKRLLRRLLGRYVPRELFERPKQGFGIPVGAWLQKPPLRDWAEALLGLEDGVFDPAAVRDAWRRGDHDRVWSVLMYRAWAEGSRR